MKDRHGPRAILDDDLLARPHACHQRSKVARRFRLGDVDHVLSHEAIIHRYLLMLCPSACICSCTWLRADDGTISCAGDTDSRLGSIPAPCDPSPPICLATFPFSFL